MASQAGLVLTDLKALASQNTPESSQFEIRFHLPRSSAMPPKLFCTGTTGYIGGDFLHLVSQKHRDWEITCIARNSDKGAKIVTAFPKIKLVYGDLEAVDLIEEEASKADIVYHFANCDHEPSAIAIAKGLARRTADGPGFWIHTSGTLILGYETMANSEYGNLLSKVYDDWDGVDELTSQPDEAAHRNVDKIVLAASSEKVMTAIVCPPTIYGPGRGPDNQRSVQVYEATRLMLETQQAFMIGKGANIWHSVHVQDLSVLYLLLGEAAVSGGLPATWNDKGYYLAENGSFMWGNVLTSVADIAVEKGLLQKQEIQVLTPEEGEALKKSLKYSIGTNSRGVSIRGKRLLGWIPKQRSLQDEVADIVDGEARRCGLTKGHAATVEGA